MKKTIIAECCQNHNGDIKTLKDMIWSAAEAGADYVKIQSMLADDIAFRERFEEGINENGIQKAIKRPYKAEYDRLKPLDIDDDTHHWFIEECIKAGIKPMTTVFSRSRIPFLASLPWDAIKIASYDCGSFPMLMDLKKNFKHLYISTGATHTDDIIKASKLLNGHDFTLLHCVTIYPTPLDKMNLARLNFLRKLAPSVGFSDHSLVARDGLKASAVAILLGAEVIERHYTVLKPEESRDGPVSINPQQLKELVALAEMPEDELADYVSQNVGDYTQMIGKEDLPLSDAELLNRDYYRGRFASRVGDRMIDNWEEVELA